MICHCFTLHSPLSILKSDRWTDFLKSWLKVPGANTHRGLFFHSVRNSQSTITTAAGISYRASAAAGCRWWKVVTLSPWRMSYSRRAEANWVGITTHKLPHNCQSRLPHQRCHVSPTETWSPYHIRRLPKIIAVWSQSVSTLSHLQYEDRPLSKQYRPPSHLMILFWVDNEEE